MATLSNPDFFEELTICADEIANFLLQPKYLNRFNPKHLRDAVTLYIRSGGKRLRPAILLWSCGAVGADPKMAIPAAAAVEIFHTWTLVHDDIIDRDDLRRGSATVHKHFHEEGKRDFPELSDEDAFHYGTSVAVLAGDIQHGWGISMMAELTEEHGLAPEVAIHLIERLDNEVLNLLVDGEVLDVQFCHVPLEELTREEIENMLWKKTGVLYRYCAEAGGMIGMGKVDIEEPKLKALSDFSSQCGIAFQLQDDLLGVIGDSNMTGKPVGNDIREGKRTSLVHFAYANSNESEKEIISRTLGNQNADEKDVKKVISILDNRGGIEETRKRARKYIESALPRLDILEDSKYRDLLRTWGEFMINRDI